MPNRQYATAMTDDLTEDGRGRIRIFAEFNEPETEVGVITYPTSDDPDRNEQNIYDELAEVGYHRIGATDRMDDGLIVPVWMQAR